MATIRRLRIAQVRSISSLELAPSPAWNWLIGPNGSGKSSLLEAVHLLGYGNTWRHRGRGLVADGQPQSTVFAEVAGKSGECRIGVARTSAGEKMVRLSQPLPLNPNGL